MHRGPRKTTPKVRGGRVQRKNRAAPTPTYWNTPQPVPQLDREDPGRGFRHLLRAPDVLRFIELLPEWDELAVGLNAVVLARGEPHLDGWHEPGVIGLCAWERDLWRYVEPRYYADHGALWERLGVPTRKAGGGLYELQFTEGTGRAYQLLHIFLHELGHHHDRMTTRSRRVSRGESYAEAYAHEHADTVWERYLAAFGLD